MFIHVRINEFVTSPDGLEKLKEWDRIETFDSKKGFESTGAIWVKKNSEFTPGGGKIYNSFEEWQLTRK